MVPDHLLPALRALGVPLLDCSLLDGPPLCAFGFGASQEALPAEGSFGRRLLLALSSLHLADSLAVLPFSVLAADSAESGLAPGLDLGLGLGQGLGSDPQLLDFASLSWPHRKDILLALFAAHQGQQGRGPGLTAQEIALFKQLPLFTRQADGQAVSLPVNEKVFFCLDPALLTSLSEPDLMGPSPAPSPSSPGRPLVVRHDPALTELYALLAVCELTPILSVKEFVVPHVHLLSGERRLQVMTSLSLNWPQFRTDPDLLRVLSQVAFVPTRTDGQAGETAYRRADELFLWTNEELLSVLTCPLEGPGLGWVDRYFAPPPLRTSQMKDMLSDLGSSATLTEPALLALIADLEDGDGRTGMDKTVLVCMSRRLIRYLLREDRLSMLLQGNRTLAGRLGQRKFVPCRRPLSVQPGGFVEYEDETLCSWGQTAVGTGGPLCFTVLPVLEEDLCPPVFHCSSLGITNSPSTEASQ